MANFVTPGIPLLGGKFQQAVGNVIDQVGSRLGIPFDTGLSEWAAGGPTTNTKVNQSYASSGPNMSVAPNQSFAPIQGSGNTTQFASNPTNFQPTQPSGGPSDSRLQELEKTDRNPVQEDEYQRLLRELQAQSGPSEEEINALYQPSLNYLGQAESQLRSQFPQFQQEAEALYGANRGQLESQRGSALGQVEQGKQQAQRKTEDVISASRRLFQELQQANRQRFGGSAAGQFASEIQGREFQSNRSDVQRDLNQTLAALQQQATNIDTDFSARIQQLEAQKMQSLNDANRQFQDRLLEINRQRGELETNKAQMRLAELQTLRDRIYQINLQQFQFQQQLQAQREAAQMELQQNASNLTGFGQAASGAVSNLNPQLLNGNVSTITPGQAQVSPGMVGQIRPEELYGQIQGSGYDQRFAQNPTNFRGGF